MKSAKAPSGDVSSNRRSQPLRQARTNPPRTSANASRSTGGREESAGDQPIDIFPAITFFADTVTALPKELVRHFTLLREVDAKICAPEEQLFELVAAALDTTKAKALLGDNTTGAVESESAPMSAQNSSTGTTLNADDVRRFPPVEPCNASLTNDQLAFRRRQLFRQISVKIQEMLVALEEKNHVIGTANESLQRQMTRIEDVWPYLEGEFSDEAKWGSTTHWAYPENRTGKHTHPERARRDGAAAISAAAQALADEAAARSDARKQAVQAKKNLKNQNQDTGFDDHDPRSHKDGGTKRSGHGKVRKTTEASGVGLGISSTANGNPPQKKRKVDNTANGGGQGERATSTVSGSNASKAKVGGASDASGPETTKKRKALPLGSGQSKKKYALSLLRCVYSTDEFPVQERHVPVGHLVSSHDISARTQGTGSGVPGPEHCTSTDHHASSRKFHTVCGGQWEEPAVLCCVWQDQRDAVRSGRYGGANHISTAGRDRCSLNQRIQRSYQHQGRAQKGGRKGRQWSGGHTERSQKGDQQGGEP